MVVSRAQSPRMSTLIDRGAISGATSPLSLLLTNYGFSSAEDFMLKGQSENLMALSLVFGTSLNCYSKVNITSN